MRSAAGYRPGKTKVEYEAPQLRHFGEMPVYETHERTLRTWDPKTKKYLRRTVTKILYAKDGKTPLRPKFQLVKVEVPGKPEGEQVIRPVTQLIPILAPIRLKKGSPKALYRRLKKLDRSAGLDNIYAAVREWV
jgi:hypothetical protein